MICVKVVHGYYFLAHVVTGTPPTLGKARKDAITL